MRQQPVIADAHAKRTERIGADARDYDPGPAEKIRQ
jgi:hypothetical protein